mgnify:CR=1 FL=1
MAVLLQINIIPIGKEGASLSDALAEVLKVVEERNIPYQLGPMSTVLEGDLDTLLEVAREMHEVCFTQGYPRVVTSIRIDDRRDKDVSMQYKTQTVEAKVGKQR